MQHMTGRQLREALRLLGLTQSDFAKEAKKTQKAVSLWVTGSGEIPEEVASLVLKLIEDRKEDQAADLLQAIRFPPIDSEAHSWPEPIFHLLWDDAEKRKRLKQLHLEATIKQNTNKPDLADVFIRIGFQEFDLGPNERLYIDHLGFPPNPRDEDSGTTWATPEFDPPAHRAKLMVDPLIREKIGPHAVGYEIYNADRFDQITVRLDAHQGLCLDDFDAIGFPLYADLLVERLMVTVTFEGLYPEPDPPTSQVYLIRRTQFRSRPTGLASDLEPPVREAGIGFRKYVFGPLLRPRGGFVYCLSWAKLKPMISEKNGNEVKR